jgi:GTP-binding protein EngB required for normal cell division
MSDDRPASGGQPVSLSSAWSSSDDVLKLVHLASLAGTRAIAADAAALADRLAEGRFFVACMGQFKRGKSTLLNALVRDAILPTGVVPVTSVVTILRYAEKRIARVRFHDGRCLEIPLHEIAVYVSEDHNPENVKGAAVVEACLPSPLLASGMCLVDTPGIGSVFAGNTETTLSFVPHIDAALVVLGADPPLSGDEMTLVEEVAHHVQHLVFVLNKADRTSAEERREASAFARKNLERRLGRAVGAILEVSATERLALGGPSRDWEALELTLRTLSQESGAQLVGAARVRGTELLVRRLLHELDEERAALTRPVEESERRVASLRWTSEAAERASVDLSYQFLAEQERLARVFAERRVEFLATSMPEAQDELEAELDRSGDGRGRAFRSRAITLAREVCSRRVDPWMREQQQSAEDMYGKAMDRFIQLANDFLVRVGVSGESGLEKLGPIGPETGFRTQARFYFHELPELAPETPLSRLLDLVLPMALVRRTVRREAAEYIAQLFRTNSTRVQNDLDERVAEGRRRLEMEIRERLREIWASAERALARASEHHAAGVEAVRTEIERIDTLRRQVEALRPSSRNGG